MLLFTGLNLGGDEAAKYSDDVAGGERLAKPCTKNRRIPLNGKDLLAEPDVQDS